MNLLFGRSPSIKFRLVLVVIISIGFIAYDSLTGSSFNLRSYLNSLVSPVFYMANAPQEALDWTREQFKSRAELMEENKQLRETQLVQQGSLQRYEFLKLENEKLRALLGSTVRNEARKLIAEVMAVDSQLHRHLIVINKGSAHGVKVGQAVIDESGVVGQIMSVGSLTSRVILISDASHAVPVRIERNDIRTVVEGIGQIGKIKVNYIPHSTDIIPGDRLVTSGLGGRFPEGYPVAKVQEVNRDRSLPFAQVSAIPVAQLDRARYVLVLLDSRQEKVEQ